MATEHQLHLIPRKPLRSQHNGRSITSVIPTDTSSSRESQALHPSILDETPLLTNTRPIGSNSFPPSGLLEDGEKEDDEDRIPVSPVDSWDGQVLSRPRWQSSSLDSPGLSRGVEQNHDHGSEPFRMLHNPGATIQRTPYRPDSVHPHKRWRPAPLRRVVLCSFILTFIASIVAIEVLLQYSDRHQGLRSVDPGNHYLWTYGPTAGFVILSAVWSQVDYRIRQMTPWWNMIRGPTIAKNSLLLDYISDFYLLTPFVAIKRKHFFVCWTVVASLLLQATATFSTGLFMSQDFDVQSSDFSLTNTKSFDGSSFNATTVDDQASLVLTTVTGFNIDYPAWTTKDYAVQPFEASTSGGNGSTFVGLVDVFSADLACETASVDISDGDDGNFSIAVSTPSCQINSSVFSFATGGYTGTFETQGCLGRSSSSGDERILVVYGNDTITYVTPTHPNETMAPPTAIVCQPSYNVTKAFVTLNNSATSFGWNNNVTVVLQNESDARQLSGLSIAELVDGVLNSMILEINGDTNNFVSLVETQAPNKNTAALLDPNVLRVASTSLFRTLGGQLAKEYLLAPAENEFAGTIIQSEHRLFVRNLSARLIEAIMALLVIGTAALVLFLPQKLLPHDPDSIGGVSILLSKSSVTSDLEGTGHLSVRALTAHLAGQSFQVDSNFNLRSLDFVIATTGGAKSEHEKFPALDNSEMEPTAPIKWWRPFATTWPAIVSIVLIPTGLIAALEVVYRLSQSRDGVADVSLDSYSRYAWTYIPALVMQTITTLFASLSSTIKTFQPYSALCRSGISGSAIMDRSPRGAPALLSLQHVNRKQHWAVIATTLSTLLAPFLTIVVSGLFVATNVAATGPVSLKVTSAFNKSLNGFDIGSEQANSLATLIETSNLSYPDWTYGDLVFPELAMIAEDPTLPEAKYLSDARSIRANIPAVRPHIDCTPLPASSVLSTSSLDDAFSFLLKIRVEDGCGAVELEDGLFGYSGNTIKFNATGAAPTSHFGSTIQMPVPGNVGDISPKLKPECPWFAWVYGLANPDSSLNLSVVTCALPYVEAVNVDVDFAMPGFQISLQDPPRPDESSTKLFSNQTQNPLVYANRGAEKLTEAGYVLPFDSFFTTLIAGKDGGVDLDVWMNASNLAPAVVRLYNNLAAQSLNVDYRTPIRSSDTRFTNAPISATFSTPSRERLTQNAISTRLLQGLLAAMTLCAIIAYATMHTRKVLPKNPCSIAAQASLLAGSELVHGGFLPPGAQSMSDEELKRQAIFRGCIFRMGWWERAEKQHMDRGPRPEGNGSGQDEAREDRPHTGHGLTNDGRNQSVEMTALLETSGSGVGDRSVRKRKRFGIDAIHPMNEL